MSEEEFSPIRPRSVPLSHVESESASAPESPRKNRWTLILGFATLAALVVLVFLVVPGLVGQPEVDTGSAQTNPRQPSEMTGPAVAEPDRPPPFQALLREQTRDKAQQELSRFVELQLKLEETMQVGQWGQADLDQAKAQATRGDEQFVAESFEASLESYRTAGDALEQLIAQGNVLLADALEAGAGALDERDKDAAEAQLRFALTIDPDNSEARAGMNRAELLPEVVSQLRVAKNYELAGDFRAALATYEQVRQLDPATAGLDDALTDARGGVSGAQFREHLSTGFRAMDDGEFETARAAFNRALAIKPRDPVALGGLEQVAERKDLATIRARKEKALAFEVAENWRGAIEQYDAVLELDGNIRFARDGRTQALEQERVQITLGNIIASPDKLSSKSLYGQAQDILAQAQSLSPRGPGLTTQISRVSGLLETYGTPVSVTLRSDNRTEVTLSTVGRLGTFEEKELHLRPGAYTIVGSRDGCRDVRESILVRPDMMPVEIRCVETF